MRSSIHGDRHFLVLEMGEEVLSCVATYAERQHISAASISGIGALTDVTLRYYELAAKRYNNKKFEDDYEILSLLGNISLLNGKSFPHIHVCLGDKNFSAFGGHLGSAKVAVTCEIVIDASPLRLERAMDERAGLPLWSCPIG